MAGNVPKDRAVPLTIFYDHGCKRSRHSKRPSVAICAPAGELLGQEAAKCSATMAVSWLARGVGRAVAYALGHARCRTRAGGSERASAQADAAIARKKPPPWGRLLSY
jgi:hypothetical protein